MSGAIRPLQGECGIGSGFESGTINERNHSIMQQTGKLQCVGGSKDTQRCLTQSECGTGQCIFVNMSEMSVSAYHDLIQGSDTVCPPAKPLSEIKLIGSLNKNSPVMSFDSRTFTTAEATSAYHEELEAMDSLGQLPAEKVIIYGTKTAPFTWQFTALADAKINSGAAGDVLIIESWIITFNSDGSFKTISETPAKTTITGLATGANDLELSMNFGTPNPSAVVGEGRDGVTEDNSGNLRIRTDVFLLCNDKCARRWNVTTAKWETTMHTLWKGRSVSDWEWVKVVYPFINIPTSLPEENVSANCFRQVQYDIQVEGSDQVLLLMDKSGSMAWSASKKESEVCSNGIDDDDDGNIDETNCADTRISFVQAAAKAYIDIQKNEGIDVGLLEFDDTSTLLSLIEPLNTTNAQVFKDKLNSLSPDGGTGIGDALIASKQEFARVATISRSRTAYLLTDGYSTAGVAPKEGADAVNDIGVRVHVIPAGSDVDSVELATVASRTSGNVLPAKEINEVASIYAELAARHQGAALSLSRRNFVLARNGKYPKDYNVKHEGKISRVTGYDISVEKGAKRLTAFVSGRNPKMSTWDVDIRLRSPSGRIYDKNSPEIEIESHYIFFSIPEPESGRWNFLIEVAGAGLQRVTALAFVKNPLPDLFVDTVPRIINAGKHATIRISPSFVSSIENDDIFSRATISDPELNISGIPIVYDRYGRSLSAETQPLFINGFYRAQVEIEVKEDAQLQKGESIFEGPARPGVKVDPFTRKADTFFLVVNGKEPKCLVESDCDQDGINKKYECLGFPQDIDNDARPNHRDWDSDGDEIPDIVEGLHDRNNNFVPDMCEKGPIIKPAKSRKKEDCLSINPKELKVKNIDNRWNLITNSSTLFDFGKNNRNAEKTLDILTYYSARKVCFIGRPDASLTYILTPNGAPKRAFSNEDCISFIPNQLRVTNISGRWKIVNGSSWLFDLSDNETEARDAYDIPMTLEN